MKMQRLDQPIPKECSLSIGIVLKSLLIPFAIVLIFGTFGSTNTGIPTPSQTQDRRIGMHPKVHGGSATDAGTEYGGRQYAIVTAYTSRVEETDSSPYTTASGVNLKERFDCIVAHNSLPFGTKVAIDDIGVCEVQDRGAKRNGANWFDVYFGNDVVRALEFGKRQLAFRVIG
jgi:3D (Asp-Asp-Asp) domain-containing protein